MAKIMHLYARVAEASKLMRHSNVIYAVLIVLLCGTCVNAQKLLLNQAYLNEFPAVERVRAEMKGSDEVDSEARFMAALDVLNNFMIRDLLRAPNGGMFNMPPAADKIHDRYRVAITKLVIDSPEPPSKDPRFRPLRDKYERDPAFADSLLQKFFTPQFRSDYYAWTGKPMPASSVAVKAGGTATAPDPSIAKAKAAKVDLSLFAGSIHFGDPLRLPRCPYVKGLLDVPQLGTITQDCENIEPPSALMNSATDMITSMLPNSDSAKPAPTPDPNLRYIILVEDHQPSWMDVGGHVGVRLNDGGGVERVFMLTRGRAVENRVAEDLKAKYGVATYTEDGTITPDVGNAFKVHNRTWVLPGLHIEYQVIGMDKDGHVQIDGPGYIWIETEAAYARRMADEEKKKKKGVL